MKSKHFIYMYVGLVVIYLGLVFALPVDPKTVQQYGLSSLELRLLLVSVVLPAILIWLISLYGFLRFRAYEFVIKKEKEGPAFGRLVQGLMVLSFSLPVNSIVGSLLDYVAFRNPEFLASSTIFRNYTTLLYQLVAFSLIAKGALALRGTLKTKKKGNSQRLAIGTVAFSSFFTWIVLARPIAGDTGDIYYLPNWLIVLTLIIPYLITWYMGLIAIENLTAYQRQVKGMVYRGALLNLVRGIGVIIVLSIFIQILLTLSENITASNLTVVLLLVYVLLSLYIVGFGLVARGARHLKKLEEV